MLSVKFDFLNIVDFCEDDIEGDVLYFTLKNSNDDYVNACVMLSKKTISFEKFDVWNPEKSIDVDLDCFYVTNECACIVNDFDGVLAINNMPFVLTGDQVNTINHYLEGMAV